MLENFQHKLFINKNIPTAIYMVPFVELKKF
ncbi:MAG: hypothetical protein BWX51_00491 [Bacteroidetes bacterium ADurb.Bin012]|jgi:hypothetical protein|nr:MAG: hypothetical protein BWX51_00491 [Bacteroidetes bacterium ADurb.Bin012]